MMVIFPQGILMFLYYYPGLRPPLLKQKGNGAVAGFYVSKRLTTA
jgi:hypothetical protein